MALMTQLHTLVESYVFPSGTCSYWAPITCTLSIPRVLLPLCGVRLKAHLSTCNRRGVKLVPPTSHGSNQGSLVPNSPHQSSEIKRCWLKCFFSQVVLIDVIKGDLDICFSPSVRDCCTDLYIPLFSPFCFYSWMLYIFKQITDQHNCIIRIVF